jgi:hypothetical protein
MPKVLFQEEYIIKTRPLYGQTIKGFSSSLFTHKLKKSNLIPSKRTFNNHSRKYLNPLCEK